ncbi:hypothetical protein DSO57_1024894 [Entomophthora muscae]|uniref:Uncharacterized protein n=1 Tax=Entomophthora muscae TaxID=34485 RepID=A0ACC2SF70_9FUNG|nr:hypothetical protein DSO57_1024894 [Entomophthora muscae]
MSRKIDALSRSDDDPMSTPTKKKLLRNVANALLNKTAPIVKAGLLGAIIDALPHVLASRKRIPSSPKVDDLRNLFSTFSDEILNGFF